jgi:hypothetical protein
LPARVLLHGEPASALRAEVIALRARFQQLQYILTADGE